MTMVRHPKIAILLPAAHAAPPSPPSCEDFGVNTSSGSCSTQWIGECETAWAAFGKASSLRIMTDGADDAVFIKPRAGSTLANGIKKTFLVKAGREFTVGMNTVAVEPNGGTITVGITFKFKNASGATVSTETQTEALGVVQYFAMARIVPATAKTVEVTIGANQPPGSIARLAVVDVNVTQARWKQTKSTRWYELSTFPGFDDVTREGLSPPIE